MNAIFVQGLSSAFSMCSAHREFNRPNGIDIALVNGDGVVVAIETKGMVSNSHRGDRNRISIDVHGVRTKLYRDKRDNNSIESDIADSAYTPDTSAEIAASTVRWLREVPRTRRRELTGMRDLLARTTPSGRPSCSRVAA